MTNPGPFISQLPRRWPRTLFLSVSAGVLLLVLIAARDVLLPFVLALVIAYVLTPGVAWLERKKVPRAAAILLTYAVVLGTMWLFGRVTAPRIVAELGALRREIPGLIGHVRTNLLPRGQEKLRELGLAPPPAPPDVDKPEEPAAVVRTRPDGSVAVEVGSGLVVRPAHGGGFVVEGVRDDKAEPFDPNRVLADAVGKSLVYAQKNALELARIGQTVIAKVSRVIFIFFITLMLAAYLMLTRERVVTFFESLIRPSGRSAFRFYLERVDKGLAGVVRGQLIICVVNGVLTAIGFALVGLKYWPVLSIIATVCSLIPIFGSIISSVPAVALGLTQSLGTATFVLVWIIGIHQLEANVLNPKIMGDQAKIHPVLVVFSLLVGEHFFHTVGALLAVPCMSIALSTFTHFRWVVQRTDPELAPEPVGSLPPPPPSARVSTSA